MVVVALGGDPPRGSCPVGEELGQLVEGRAVPGEERLSRLAQGGDEVLILGEEASDVGTLIERPVGMLVSEDGVEAARDG